MVRGTLGVGYLDPMQHLEKHTREAYGTVAGTITLVSGTLKSNL